MVLAVMTEPQFQRLMKELGRADALADPRFADWPTRIANNKALHEIIEAAMKKETSATWAERFAKADVPAGRVLTHSRDRAARPLRRTAPMLQTVDTAHGPIKVVGSGFRLEHGGGSVDRPPATLGQHTDEVLREAGYRRRRDRRDADGQGRLDFGPMPILYDVEHVTTYRYKTPVTFGAHRAMFLPRSGPYGRILSYSATTNLASRVRWIIDALSNVVTLIDIDEPGRSSPSPSGCAASTTASPRPRPFRWKRGPKTCRCNTPRMSGRISPAICVRTPRMRTARSRRGPSLSSV